MLTALVHLYKPGAKMSPPIAPKKFIRQEYDITCYQLTAREIVEIRVYPTSGVGERGAHVADGGRERRRGRCRIGCGKEVSCDLARGRKLSGRVDGEGETGEAGGCDWTNTDGTS